MVQNETKKGKNENTKHKRTEDNKQRGKRARASRQASGAVRHANIHCSAPPTGWLTDYNTALVVETQAG